MTPRLALTREEAAASCGVSLNTVKRAIAAGHLRAKRSGVNDKGDPAGKYLITPEALREWLDGLADA